MMRDEMMQVDPEWAWQPYEAQGGLTKRQAAHLLRRSGFGGSPDELASIQTQAPSAALRSFVEQGSADKGFEEEANSLARVILATGEPESLSAAWVYRLLHTGNPLLEKCTLFWHGHFATSAAKVHISKLMWQQNKLLRENALGSFTKLVQGIAQDPAMLIYLDSASNRKTAPNENFARELMELFCLGEGKYTERDVQELARCFTGWEIKNDRFRKNRYQQDRNAKTVLGESGKLDGEDAIKIVLEREDAAFFICRKLVRYFVCDEPALSDKLLAPLAKLFRDSNLEIAPVVSRILGSNFFFSTHSIARKIRSPVDFCVGSMRSLKATTNTFRVAKGLNSIGQGLFYPPNVKGWDGGRTWINSSTLLGRANLIDQILSDEKSKFAGGSLSDFFEAQTVAKSEILDWIDQNTFAVPLGKAARERLQALLDEAGDWNKRLRNTLQASFSLPEYQLG